MLLTLLLLACDGPLVVTEHPLVPPDQGRVVPELIGAWALAPSEATYAIDASDGAMRVRERDGDGWGAPRPLPIWRMKGDLYTQMPQTQADIAPGHTSSTGAYTWPLRLHVHDSQLTISALSPDWFFARQGQDLGLDIFIPGTVRAVVKDGQTTWTGSNIILRDDTRHLRRWLRRHHDADGLFLGVGVLTRVGDAPAP